MFISVHYIYIEQLKRMIKDRKLIDPPLHLHVNKPIKDFKKLKGQRAKYIDDVLIGLRDLAIP